jgi:hypothetical protein
VTTTEISASAVEQVAPARAAKITPAQHTVLESRVIRSRVMSGRGIGFNGKEVWLLAGWTNRPDVTRTVEALINKGMLVKTRAGVAITEMGRAAIAKAEGRS